MYVIYFLRMYIKRLLKGSTHSEAVVLAKLYAKAHADVDKIPKSKKKK